MKTIIQKLSKAIQAVLVAPVTLPIKVVQVVKYVAVALGILEAVVKDENKEDQTSDCDETAD